MANLFDLRNNIDHDDWELGMRVAVSLFVENVTDSENFIRILSTQYRIRKR